MKRVSCIANLKPANIKVTPDGHCKAAGFRLASTTAGKETADTTVSMSLTQPE